MITFLVILNLVILECLLSVDNAAVLAVMVKVLPKEQQTKALRYGILGAYIFRGIALLFATWLVKIIWLKILGGAFLLWLAYKHFFGQETEEDHKVKSIPGLSQFWSTVVFVEIADITFSLDNVFAAVALSDEFWVVVVGVFVGILAMRFVAQWFIKMIEKYPALNNSAFIVIAILGLKLVVNGIVDYIPSAHGMREFLESHYTDLGVSALTLIIFLLPILFHKKQIA